MKKPLPTFERVSQILRYDPESGDLIHLQARGRARAGAVAGCVRAVGYIYVLVDGRQLLAHRVAWLLMTGAWPVGQIDHRNMVRTDNRWVNLREATNSQNGLNRKRQSNSRQPYKGIERHRDRWAARISIAGKRKHLGMFATAEAARDAYLEAARQAHGEFARGDFGFAPAPFDVL